MYKTPSVQSQSCNRKKKIQNSQQHYNPSYYSRNIKQNVKTKKQKTKKQEQVIALTGADSYTACRI
jgi:hypothetical protein